MHVKTVRSDGCLSYVLLAGRDAAIVDPARDTTKYRALLSGATLRFVIDTHTHADHLSGARKLADELGARLVMSRAHSEQWRAAEGKADALGIGDILRANAGVVVDHAATDGESLELGGEELRLVAAPGHTLDSLVLLNGDHAFTGDTLLIGQTGRCDLPGGDGAALHDTLFRKLATLPDETFVHPGHDYDGLTVTALGFERVKSPFLKTRDRDEFLEFLKGAFPTLTGAGMQCGASRTGEASCGEGPAPDPLRDEVAGFMGSYFFADHRPEDLIRPLDLKREMDSGRSLVILDVREPSEFAAGHIEGAVNLSVHELDRRLREVPPDKHQEIVTICRSGKRSAWATMFLRVAGWKRVRSVPGGMLEWEQESLPVRKGR